MMDLIDRQEAIKAVSDLYAIYGSEGEWVDRRDVFNALKKMPSAQLEIIYCNDCRFFVDHRCRHWRTLDDWRGANDYCSKAERKGAQDG